MHLMAFNMYSLSLVFIFTQSFYFPPNIFTYWCIWEHVKRIGFPICLTFCYIRKIFRPKKDEVTGEGRRLHNEELYDLYSSPRVIQVCKIKKIRWAGNVARLGDRRRAD